MFFWSLIGLLMVAVLGIALFLVNWFGDHDSLAAGTESVKQGTLTYEQVKDFGTLPQLTALLSELTSKKTSAEKVPVRLDNNNKTIEIADRILAQDSLSEGERASAIRAKLKSLQDSYIVAVENDLRDPFIAEQLIGTTEKYLDDPNKTISRDAHINQATGLVSETVNKRFLGGFDRIEKSILKLTSLFPEDPLVMGHVKELFTRIRAFDADQSIKLATKIAEVADENDSESTASLSRFMKDIIALYDAGIGNFRTIGSIIVNDTEFMGRLEKLLVDDDTGVTVVTQLDNAVEFFERQSKYSQALRLSQNILTKAPQRTNPEARKLATLVGNNGVTRNSLVGKSWPFNTEDYFGNSIASDRFNDRVVMVIFFTQELALKHQIMPLILKISKTFLGRPLELVLVEVCPPGATPLAAENRDDWITIASPEKNPHKYLVNCPTRRFPYGILIDKNGKVDSINVSFKNIRTRIEYLLSLD